MQDTLTGPAETSGLSYGTPGAFERLLDAKRNGAGNTSFRVPHADVGTDLHAGRSPMLSVSTFPLTFKRPQQTPRFATYTLRHREPRLLPLDCVCCIRDVLCAEVHWKGMIGGAPSASVSTSESPNFNLFAI
jgi:hypothetical protein